MGDTMTGNEMLGRQEPRPLLRLPVVIATVTLGIIMAACTPALQTAGSGSPSSMPGPSAGPPATAATAPGRGASQKDEGGQVTVEVTWQGADNGPVFKVALDTHTIDLDGYDLRQTAVLRTEDGRELRPTGWDAPRGGHHRAGLLTFPATFPDGTPVITSGRTVELIFRDLAGVPERTFRWAT